MQSRPNINLSVFAVYLQIEKRGEGCTSYKDALSGRLEPCKILPLRRAPPLRKSFNLGVGAEGRVLVEECRAVESVKRREAVLTR
jgi:hypothetical protein